MIRYLLLLLTITSTFCFGEDISQKNKPITVKVLLTKLSDEALLEVRGCHLIYNPRTDELIATGSKKKRCKISSSDTGLVWGDPLPGMHEIRIVPNDRKSAILVNGIQYKGCVEIYGIGGTINIVNEVDTENYLKSVLASKITEKMSKEALDSIVITERTDLYYTIQKDSYASWQIEAEKVNYGGYAAAKQNSSVQEAVERTRDLVLNYKKQPFNTHWSLNNAGHSVSHTSIFRKNTTTPEGVNHLPSVHHRDKSKWQLTVPTKTLANLAGLTSITEIDLFRAKNTNKIYALRIKSPEGKKDLDFFTLQKALGPQLLLSNDFTLSHKGKKITFAGFGKGAGVGLCVDSANIMAKRKDSPEKILTYHFPGTELVNMRQETGQSSIINPIWK